MFLICCSIFLVCTWIAAFLSNSAADRMLDEVNSHRLNGTKISPYWWNIGKFQKLWQLHRSIAPVSTLRKRYLIGLSIGSVGFVIAAIGMFSSIGTATVSR